MMRALFISAALLGLAACAAPTTTSWVEGPLTASDNLVLAGAMVQITVSVALSPRIRRLA